MKSSGSCAPAPPGVLAGLWLTARILLPVGLPFLLGLGLLARLACRAPAPPAARAGCFSQRDGRVPAAAAVLTGLGWGVAGLRCPVRPSARPASHAGRAAAAPACRGPRSGQPPAGRDGRGCSPVGRPAVCGRKCRGRLRVAGRVRLRHARARLDAAAAALRADGPAVRLFPRGRCAEAPRPAARHVPEEWRARGGQLLVRLRAAPAGLCPRTGKLLLVTFGVVSLGLLAALRRPHAVLFGRAHRRGRCPAVLGSGTVLLPWAAVSLLRGSGGLALGLTVTYAAAAFARSALEPRLLGRQIGLPPLLTLLRSTRAIACSVLQG